MHVPHAFIPIFQTIYALHFGFDLAPFEIFCVAHHADHFLRRLAERVEYLVLFQVGFQRFAIWMRLTLMNQLFDSFSAGVVFWQCNWMRYSWNSEVNGTAMSFLVLSSFAVTGFPVLSVLVVVGFARQLNNETVWHFSNTKKTMMNARRVLNQKPSIRPQGWNVILRNKTYQAQGGSTVSKFVPSIARVV